MPSTASIPSWLQTSPDDIANKFVSGLQIGAQLGEARNKLAQQAQQSAVENQVTQDKLASDAVETAQKLQVQQAYNDQQISLKQQEVAAAQEKVRNETMKAAAQFQAQKSFNIDRADYMTTHPGDDEGGTRYAFMRNPTLFGTGAGAASAFKGLSTQADIPQTMKFTDERGNVHNILYRGQGSTTHDLDSRSNAGEVWQAHHDITRSEKLSDTQRAAQITDFRDQLKTASDPDEIKKIRSNLDSLLNPPAKSAMSIPTSDAITPNPGIKVTGPSSNVGLFDSPAAAPTASNPYQVGRQYGKLRYKGGDPNNQGSWEPVQ